MSLAWPLAEAFTLGLVTSVLPCVLAQNVAAVSYLGQRMGGPRHALLSAGLYVLGRSAVYVGIAAVTVLTAISQADLLTFLQRHINQVMGPVMILGGMLILGLLNFRGPSPAGVDQLQKRIDAGSLTTACLLGVLLALCFCPPVAAIYSRLLLASVEHESPVLMPLAFGLGTALPIALVGVLVALGARSLGRVIGAMQMVERWTRRATGTVFILVGIAYSLVYIFGIPLPW